jgi:serine protease
VRYTSRATLSVGVNVPHIANPTGELRVYDGSRRIATATLYSSQLGKRTILLPRLSKGYHLIKVTYMGNSLITSKTSAVRGIKSY